MSPLEYCDLRKLSQHLCILLCTAEPHRICCVLQPLLIESLLQSVLWASQVAQRERICLPMQETRSLTPVGQIPLEKEMTIHSCILAWKSHGQRSLAGYSPWGHKESDTPEQLSMHEGQIPIIFWL